MTFSEQALGSHLQSLLSQTPQNASSQLATKNSAVSVLWVAYSGGLDSHVLLVAMANLFASGYFKKSQFSLKVLHINHGLSPHAEHWSAHCEQVCADLGLPLTVSKVDLMDASGSIETLARKARYEVFNAIVKAGDYLLLAHHQDDQLETMLFRMLRGSGPRGLAAIPTCRALDQGLLLRPLLEFSRLQLHDYGVDQGLSWVEDESNQDTNYDRNFLRHEIFPLLKQRWPAFANNWQRTAQLCGEADKLQTIVAEQDFQAVKTAYLNRLDIAALNRFEAMRQRNILRHWFMQLQRRFDLAQPDFNALERILNEVLPAAEDKAPLVSWAQGSNQTDVRRFAGQLYVLKPDIAIPLESSLSWQPTQDLQLPNALGNLSMVSVESNGIDMANVAELTIKFRQGGEQAKPAGRKTKSLKKIFQDYKVPPWLRDRVPLIYINGELVAVADLFICEQWQVTEGENLQAFCWQKSDIHCGY